MRLTERSLSVTEEKRIVTGLIVSTEFTREIINAVEFDYFTNSYLRKVAEWSITFYEEHEKAPYKHIEDIYDSESHKLKPSEAELIRDLLTDLSKSYDPESFNVDYVKSTTETYFRRRELEITTNNISILKDEGNLAEAEAEINRFNKVSISLDESIYLNPGDSEQREKLYRKREKNEEKFFTFPGDLGLFVGNMKKGDVVGITAPAKRGKSFLITNIFNQCVMLRRKSLFFSIEMTDTEMLTRVDKSFVPSVGNGQEEGEYQYPVFDCRHNQTGECSRRNSNVTVLDDEGTLELNPSHIVCTKCRDDRTNRFDAVVYHDTIYRLKNDIYTMREEMKSFDKLLNKYARIVTRPKYSLTYDLIKHDLYVMESRYNFIPEIIVLDYIDILGVDSKHDDYKLDDEKWMLMQKLAGETKCLVITPTQGNKDSYKAKTLHTTDQAGFYGKGRHVNLMLGINQDAIEKTNGIWRLGKLDARDSHFDTEDTCMVLQDLKTGQMHLDSYWKNKHRHNF
jgi:hypothetical protein